MPDAYADLARKRASNPPPENCKQPEDFKYQFEDWISPYTKGACATGGVAVVLQDWASADKLGEGVHPEIQRLGRDPEIRTNAVLSYVLGQVFNLTIEDVYGTNVFPYVKAGSMSGRIVMKAMYETAEAFTKPELALANPSIVLALGKAPAAALRRVGVHCIALPHPAARIGTADHHVDRWRDAFKAYVHSVDPHPSAARMRAGLRAFVSQGRRFAL